MLTRRLALSPLLMLAACATTPAIEIHAAPQRPAATTFRLAGPRDAKAAAPAADAEVARALVAAGWTAVDKAPRWEVETSYTLRSERAGAFAVEATPTTPNDWLAAPGKKAWWRRERAVRTLTVRFIDPATGAEGARLSAATAHDADLAALAKAAVTPAP